MAPAGSPGFNGLGMRRRAGDDLGGGRRPTARATDPLNTQTAELFAAERAIIDEAAVPLTWVRPSDHDPDRPEAVEAITLGAADTPEVDLPVAPGAWLNAVEGFFSRLTRQSLKRGVFRSVDDLEKAITRYIAATNNSPRPFVWSATAKAIRTKLAVDHPSESVH